MSTDDKPFRNWDHTPRVLCRVDPAAPSDAVCAIQKRMLAIFRKHGGKAYLFINSGGSARVLHENYSTLRPWLKSHWSDLVGVYTSDGIKGLDTDLAGLLEDVADHLRAGRND